MVDVKEMSLGNIIREAVELNFDFCYKTRRLLVDGNSTEFNECKSRLSMLYEEINRRDKMLREIYKVY